MRSNRNYFAASTYCTVSNARYEENHQIGGVGSMAHLGVVFLHCVTEYMHQSENVNAQSRIVYPALRYNFHEL